jgi:hypothetical protein
MTQRKPNTTLLERAERVCNGANTHKIRSLMSLYINACECINYEMYEKDIEARKDSWEKELLEIVQKEEEQKLKFL